MLIVKKKLLDNKIRLCAQDKLRLLPEMYMYIAPTEFTRKQTYIIVSFPVLSMCMYPFRYNYGPFRSFLVSLFGVFSVFFGVFLVLFGPFWSFSVPFGPFRSLLATGKQCEDAKQVEFTTLLSYFMKKLSENIY